MPTTWDFPRFKKEFFLYTGLNLENYKDKQMERRINQLLVREGFPSLCSFFDSLKTDGENLHKFYNYLTINTSTFYRDDKIYDYLETTAMKNLLSRFNHLNIWSMGCSHGEEPYSLALILDKLGALQRASILASDIDEKALEMARLGKYARNQLEKVPPAIFEKGFINKEDGFYINPKYKRAVTFQKHNLLEPIYKKMQPKQLALCRNVFIYFKTEVQEWIVEQVAELVPSGGYFVIGCAEFINNPERFGLERKIPSIYEKM